jgi:hypothetical protein
MKLPTTFRALFPAGLVVLTACASRGDPGIDDSAAAALAAPEGPRQVNAKYPAFKVPAPVVENLGGPILRSPRIVPISFTGDALADDIERFASILGSSDYWKTTTAEYGIGPATSATPLRAGDTVPATITDDEIRAWLTEKLTSGSPEWPTPDDDTLYAIYYPAGTTVMYGGFESCQAFGAYHYQVKLPTGRTVPYAVLPRCERFMNYPLDALELLTVASSHEFIEAVTDPYPDSAPAYLRVDSFYGLPFSASELGDTCNAHSRINGTVDDAPIQQPGFPYMVQRVWSNKAALAGHDPCVPSTGAYFNAFPITEDTFDATPIQGSRALPGWKIAAGETKTIEVDLFSDASTGGPFSLKVDDITALDDAASSNVKLTLDKKSGINGDKVHLTAGILPGAATYVVFRITAELGAKKSYWYGTIQTAPSADDAASGVGVAPRGPGSSF